MAFRVLLVVAVLVAFYGCGQSKPVPDPEQFPVKEKTEAAPKPETTAGRRDATARWSAPYTYIGGLRVTETVDLRTRDLLARDDGHGGQLQVFGKGSKTRPVLVPAGLFEELSAIALPDHDAPLFRSQKKGPDGGLKPIIARQAERIIKAVAKKAGLKNAPEVSPHWLRHAHTSHAMDRGAKIHLV